MAQIARDFVALGTRRVTELGARLTSVYDRQTGGHRGRAAEAKGVVAGELWRHRRLTGSRRLEAAALVGLWGYRCDWRNRTRLLGRTRLALRGQRLQTRAFYVGATFRTPAVGGGMRLPVSSSPSGVFACGM